MNINKIPHLIKDYTTWLKDQTVFQSLEDGYVEVTTPYINRHNDCLQIYIKESPNGLLLTDGGYIIEDLEMSGCSLEGEARQNLFKMILAGFGIEHDKKTNELVVESNIKDFPLKHNNLIQAMLSVDNMFYLARPHIASLFIEDVASWMNEHVIKYATNVELRGKTGYTHKFDFSISHAQNKLQSILQAVNNPTAENAKKLIFYWQDTQESRTENSKLYAILNDSNDNFISSDVTDAFGKYEITSLPWSEREDYIAELAA